MCVNCSRAIRDCFPSARLTILAKPSVAGFYEREPFADDVMSYTAITLASKGCLPDSHYASWPVRLCHPAAECLRSGAAGLAGANSGAYRIRPRCYATFYATSTLCRRHVEEEIPRHEPLLLPGVSWKPPPESFRRSSPAPGSTWTGRRFIPRGSSESVRAPPTVRPSAGSPSVLPKRRPAWHAERGGLHRPAVQDRRMSGRCAIAWPR